MSYISIQAPFVTVGPDARNDRDLFPLLDGTRVSFSDTVGFNFIDNAGTLTLSILTAVGVGGLTAVVPEPSTLASLFSGLGVVVVAVSGLCGPQQPADMDFRVRENWG